MSLSITEFGALLAATESDKERTETFLRFVSDLDLTDHGDLVGGMAWLAEDPGELHELRALAVATHIVAYCGMLEGKDVTPIAERAVELFGELGDRYSQGVILYQMCGAARNRFDNDLARRYIDHALAIFQEEGTEKSIAACYNKIGKIHADQGDHVTALEYLRRALEMNERLGERGGVAVDLNSIGIVYHAMSNYDRALEYMLKGLAVNEEIGNVKELGRQLLDVGHLYLDLKDYDRALKHLNRAYTIAQELGDRQQMSKLLHNIGTIYSEQGEYDRALEAFHEALAVKEEFGDKRGVANALNNIGNIHQHLGDYTRAFDYYRRSLAIKEEVGNGEAIVRTLMNIGSAYIACDDIPAALEVLDRGLRIYVEGKQKPLYRNLHRNFADAYKKLGDFERALEHFEQYATLDREIFDEASAKRLHELGVIFEVERAEREARILRLTNERLEQEIEFKKKELTTSALYLTQKNETLREVRRRIETIMNESDVGVAGRLRSLATEIEQAVNTEDYWATFEKQFKQVHSDFLEILAERYPKLTPTELKVCALIKIDLSTKEIAQILNAEARSVEKYRQRIRKKLMLRQDENLGAFLLAIR